MARAGDARTRPTAARGTARSWRRSCRSARRTERAFRRARRWARWAGARRTAKQAWCWALKMGYARDRVIAYARVKQAMLDVHNLSAGPEVHTALFRVWVRANAGLREAGARAARRRARRRARTRRRSIRDAPQWARTGEDVPNAQRQQPTLAASPLVTGLTAREVGARARRPVARAGRNVRRRREHARADAGARRAAWARRRSCRSPSRRPTTRSCTRWARDARACATDEHDCEMPALVTLHNATGAVEPICGGWASRCAFNVFMTDDAARCSPICTR